MSIKNMIRRFVESKLLTLATEKMREMLEEFIEKADTYAQSTKNTVDDMIVQVLREGFGIPKAKNPDDPEPE